MEHLTHVRSDLFKGFTKEEFVYFVHSFYVPLNEFTAAQTDYILPYSSALHKDNFLCNTVSSRKEWSRGRTNPEELFRIVNHYIIYNNV